MYLVHIMQLVYSILWYYVTFSWDLKWEICIKQEQILVKYLRETSDKWISLVFGSVTSLWTIMSVCRSVCLNFLNVRLLGNCRLLLLLLENPSSPRQISLKLRYLNNQKKVQRRKEKIQIEKKTIFSFCSQSRPHPLKRIISS